MKRNNPWPNGAFCYKNVKKPRTFWKNAKRFSARDDSLGFEKAVATSFCSLKFTLSLHYLI